MSLPPLPLYRRIQIELGIRWDVMPGRLSWKKWAFDPYANLIWPKKIIDPVKDWPEGLSRQHYIDREGLPDRDPVTNLYPAIWRAKFFWATGAVRICGLDIGAAIMFLPKI